MCQTYHINVRQRLESLSTYPKYTREQRRHFSSSQKEASVSEDIKCCRRHGGRLVQWYLLPRPDLRLRAALSRKINSTSVKDYVASFQDRRKTQFPRSSKWNVTAGKQQPPVASARDSSFLYDLFLVSHCLNYREV